MGLRSKEDESLHTFGRTFWLSSWPTTVILWAFTIAGIWMKWCKLNSLLFLDPAWWLNEYGRYARGELPYRDFYWPYGPLSADIFAAAMRVFGAHFAVAQVVIDLLSLVVLVLVYKIAAQLVPAPLSQLIAIWLVAVGITARTFFSLFSLISYTPAVHVAAIGLLLMIWAAIGYIDDGQPRITWIAAGAWCACLSKQEALLASLVLFVVLAAFDRRLTFRDRTTTAWMRRYVSFGLWCFGVPVAVYLLWAWHSGYGKFFSCFQGFGLATMSCPWWPTGFGITGAIVELGEAWTVFTIASLLIPSLRARLSQKYGLMWMVAACATAAMIAFHWRLYSDLLFGSDTLAKRFVRDMTELLSTSAILRPVLWAAYIYGAAILINGFRHSFTLPKTQIKNLILIAVPCIMSLRSLFGSTLALNLLEVPAISYPFLLLLGPYLLYAALTHHLPSKTPGVIPVDKQALAVLSVILVAYCVVRLIGGYPVLLSSAAFSQLDTPAGRIWLKEYATEKPVLECILAHTSPSDTILELPFGGGMSFATGRKQPTYSTLFIQLRPPTAIQFEDLRRITAHPPAVVIAKQEANLGTLYGYPGTLGCAFPKFVWQPDQPTSDPNYIFPAVAYIQRNYRVDQRVGEWALLRPIKLTEPPPLEAAH